MLRRSVAVLRRDVEIYVFLFCFVFLLLRTCLLE